MTKHAESVALPSARSEIARQMRQPDGAGLIGSFIVDGVEFSHIMPKHDAAHDVRYSAVFSCR